MGSRGRSIRLRIYFLVAIPLITMLGLFSYVAYTSVTNWLNLDRTPSLIQATSEPLTNFVNVLQAERRAAVVYLSQPSKANLAAYQGAVAATQKAQQQLTVALNSPGTRNSSTPQETAAINKMTGRLNGMAPLRASVTARKLAPLDALAAYTNVIASQGAVLQAEANSITDAAPVLQGLGLISAVNTQEDMSEQDAVLASALASGSLTGADRVAFANAVGRQQDDTLSYQQLLTPAELATYTATMDKGVPTSVQDKLATIQQAVEAGVPLREIEQQGLTPATWQGMTGAWLNASSTAGNNGAAAVLQANSQPAIDAKRRVLILAVAGAAGLILTLIVSLLLSGSINRRLTALRRAALTLAQEQLPSVVARLRRGDSVDVAAEAPPLRAGNDEIGQVGQAIDAVRQTAIMSAIDEARVRQGVNDMFRNLARRSQSLLQRQLTVLDEMERRATDPDVLEDLFKMDHLTTRMRRHAEGLIILSGAPPGRSWSAPVKLIDVMRGAVAEVEDYARVTVTTQARAALAGSAVTDLIHLLAELIENATTLSPPFTQVRVSGEIVAKGFAIEIEDRGLGMTPPRLSELNERLANPPDVNPANTEQLGLFVVGQLARRHGIDVTLRPSPYGGTSAVVLIPAALIVEDAPAALTAGGRSAGSGRTGGYLPGGPGPGSQPVMLAADGDWAGGSRWSGYRPAGAADHGSPAEYQDPGRSPIRITGPLRDAANTGGAGPGSGNDAPAPGPRRGRHGADDIPVITGMPLPRPTTLPPPIPPFDVFTPLRRTGSSDTPPAPQSYQESGGQGSAGPGRGASYASPYRGADAETTAYAVADAETTAYSVDAAYRQQSAGGAGSGRYDATGNNGDAPAGYPGGDAAGSDAPGDFKGLPRRVRQANLAPQLRASAAPGSRQPTGVPPATGASLADMRSTLSAMQRGWQQGRSQTQHDTEDSGDGS